jgi:hypothetical protein
VSAIEAFTHIITNLKAEEKGESFSKRASLLVAAFDVRADNLRSRVTSKSAKRKLVAIEIDITQYRSIPG